MAIVADYAVKPFGSKQLFKRLKHLKLSTAVVQRARTFRTKIYGKISRFLPECQLWL